MPKLINRPPKYRLHKSTGQAVISLNGPVIQLGRFGSQKSHARYQEEVANWRTVRQKQEVEEAAEPESEVTLKELQACLARLHRHDRRTGPLLPRSHPMCHCFLGDETVWLSSGRGEEADMPLKPEMLQRAHRLAIERGRLESYNVNAYRIAIHRACEKAGHAKWSPNQLRHTAPTEVRKKFGLEAAQVIRGHQSAEVTQIYAE